MISGKGCSERRPSECAGLAVETGCLHVGLVVMSSSPLTWKKQLINLRRLRRLGTNALHPLSLDGTKRWEKDAL